MYDDVSLGLTTSKETIDKAYVKKSPSLGNLNWFILVYVLVTT